MLLWAFFFPFMRALQGAGDMFVPMAISIATTFLVALPLAYALSHHTDMGHRGIWTAFLVSTAVSTVGTGAWLATGRWTRRVAARPVSDPPAA
jgi:Na+-driven multidrug efflux pump